MYNKSINVFIFLFVSAVLSWSQPCTIVVQGIVQDESTGLPLEYASVLIIETNQASVANEQGRFSITDLCPGSYHVQLHHIGCESKRLYLTITRDTQVAFLLHHHVQLLNEVEVHGTHEQATVQSAQSITNNELAKQASKNLTDILDQLAGVSTIKNGAGISKPVIQGMYGNRINVINAGMSQAGQQWGNDHAPEIDPYMADHVTVIKGTASLAYPGSGLGGLILIESGAPAEDPHLHGEVNSSYQTNGRGMTLNARLQNTHNTFSWKSGVTLKKAGDSKTADYFLTNTGKDEYNLHLQGFKHWSSRWTSDIQLSSFNAIIGILRGSHVGNVTDLTEALQRSVPFFTTDHFNSSIDPPRQEVHHHVLKWENTWQKNDHTIWSFNAGSQLNNRKEYDVRRSNRSEKPALSLRQFSHFLESKVHHEYAHQHHVKTGIQLSLIDNTNIPETGILPLIPDYISYKSAGFLILENENSKFLYEGGIRFEANPLQVWRIVNTIPKSIEHCSTFYSNFSVAGGLKYNFSESIFSAVNLGWVARAPEVNELYSNGLHQGVSGIEQGNQQLTSEQSLKISATQQFMLNKKWMFQTTLYSQYINNYIYLSPEKELRLTIRGAFPVFTYRQTDAVFTGLDGTVSFSFTDNLKWVAQFEWLKAMDRTSKAGLIYIPAPSLQHTLQWHLKDQKNVKNTYFQLKHQAVSKQKYADPALDLAPPPPGYSLFDLEGGSSWLFRTSSIHLNVLIENVFNRAYRNYLNRLRYFADETGRSITVRCSYRF